MEKIKGYLKHLYIDRQLSTNGIPEVMESEYGIRMSSGKCFHILEEMGILRSKSESISLATSSLDYSRSYLTDEMFAIIDGIVIGDGTMNVNRNTKVARVSISGAQEEFIKYCKKLLSPYGPSELSYTKSDGTKDGLGTWTVRTKFHPDIYKMYNRWYDENGVKDIPHDVSFYPVTILLWYLGDGSLSSLNKNNSRTLYFSTNSFSKESIEKNLVTKFEKIGMEVSRITSDNRLFLKTKSIVKLLKYMGGESPVKCYSYKFDIEPWRLKKSMKDVSSELNIDYQRLANWVKTGFVEHSRSPGGKKVLFSTEEFDKLMERFRSGELSREKHRKTTIRPRQDSGHSVSTQITRLKKETDEEYIERLAAIYIQNGFPYKRYSGKKLEKEFFGLRKAQYMIPSTEDIHYRKNGLAFADHFHEHLFGLNRKNKMSPISLFSDSKLLQECLWMNKAQNGMLTLSGLHSAICSNVKSPRLNNFPPLVARDLYNYYCCDGDSALDPCAGFSGRLIGAAASKRKISYTGCEPSMKTYMGLVKTQQFLRTVDTFFCSRVLNGALEDELVMLRDESFDFSFTSPPYFDIEEYSLDENQSYIRYNSYDKWRDGFLTSMIENTYRLLKPNKYFLINIGFNNYDIPSDVENIASSVGFSVECRKHILFPLYQFSRDGKSDRFRKEPLIVLRKG